MSPNIAQEKCQNNSLCVFARSAAHLHEKRILTLRLVCVEKESLG